MEPDVFVLLPGSVDRLISGKGSMSSLSVETRSLAPDVFFLLLGLGGVHISGKLPSCANPSDYKSTSQSPPTPRSARKCTVEIGEEAFTCKRDGKDENPKTRRL